MVDREDDVLRNLVFACLGWRTMLYRPTFNVCPLDNFAIQQDDGEPDSGLVFDTYRAPTELSDRPLSVLFKYFGNLLPARSPFTTHMAAETSKDVVSWTALWPEEMNASLLQTLLHVRFRWVDCLALHLDYDKSTQTLSLFRYPSLCAAMLKRTRARYSRSPAWNSSLRTRGPTTRILRPSCARFSCPTVCFLGRIPRLESCFGVFRTTSQTRYYPSYAPVNICLLAMRTGCRRTG